MTKHSTLVGGSSAERWVSCIGSDKVCAKVKGLSSSSDFADEGTMLHAAIEDILESQIEPEDVIGKQYPVGTSDDGEPQFLEVTERHVVDKLRPVVEWFDENIGDHECEFKLEMQVRFEDSLLGAFGTVDLVFWNEQRAGIVDWKFGDGVLVDAEKTHQLPFYLSAALEQHTPLPDAFKKRDDWECWIVQPAEGAEEIAQKRVITLDEVEDYIDSLIAAKEKKEAGDETLTIGDWCRWCKGQVVCDAWRNRGSDALASLPIERGKKSVDYDADALKAAYLEAVELARWCDKVKSLVSAEFKAGRPVPGLKQVVFKNIRAWADENKVRNWLRRIGLKAKDMNEPAVLKTPAKIESLIGKQKMRDDMIHTEPYGYQVVPEDDPREAVHTGQSVQAAGESLAGALQASLKN